MRCVLGSIVLLAAQAALAQTPGRILNGDFSDPTLFNHWEVVGPCAMDSRDGDRYARLDERLHGSRTRLYQDFNFPANSYAELTFRYNFISGGVKPRTTAVPPDSFMVRLIETTGGSSLANNSLGNLPGNSVACFYVDSDGKLELPGDATVSAPDSIGRRLVRIPVTVAGGTPSRIEFGLAGADNAIQTQVHIDAVQLQCPYFENFDRPDDEDVGGQVDAGGNTIWVWGEMESPDNYDGGHAQIKNGRALLTGYNNEGQLDPECTGSCAQGNRFSWITQSGIDLTAFDSNDEITLSFTWILKGAVGEFDFDRLYVEWRSHTANGWPAPAELGAPDYYTHTLPPNNIHGIVEATMIKLKIDPDFPEGQPEQEHLDLTGAGGSTIDIRFRVVVSQPNEGAYIDDVAICASPVADPGT